MFTVCLLFIVETYRLKFNESRVISSKRRLIAVGFCRAINLTSSFVVCKGRTTQLKDYYEYISWRCTCFVGDNYFNRTALCVRRCTEERTDGKLDMQRTYSYDG